MISVIQFFLIVLLGIIVVILIVEPVYVLIFNKPLYIHWYPFKRKLNPGQRAVLRKESVFYQNLSAKKKLFFEHRTATFIAKYKFFGKGDFIVTEHSKVVIAATYVMLTFGMRHYLIAVFNKIIIYPEPYLSTIRNEYHKGEFNPRLKAVVFSWKDFQEGYYCDNDNLNLGIHEFAHALYFHGLKSRDQSGVVFSSTYVKIQEYLVQPKILEQVISSNYFRIYAYTNQVEFLAVILEHFFETPHVFKKEFPELYNYVREMINFDEKNSNS
ncbi:zinc-dependent peptidase [Flavobacterium sp. Arc2]|jgi:Mlc titration factor MtfA (ptsG expression regulator)|uniref:zinc-dependent peptidase n=1 Tax=Flavobacterium sp. Arc2 TaxID=3046685 RepID=UPI00352C3C7E